MKTLILVNGVPASGKSSVARILADHFSFPLLSIDEIKEPFMLQFADVIDRPLNRKLGHAAYAAMFDIVKTAPPSVNFIMDAWFGFREKSVLEAYIAASGCQQVIEIWNQIAAETVAQRYRSRCDCRVKGHPGAEYIPELMQLAETARPMAVGEVYTLDQDRTGDSEELLRWVQQRLTPQQSLITRL